MNNEIYLDYMATTPVDPQVNRAMIDCLLQDGSFANPSSLHAAGRRANKLVEQSRAAVAAAIGAQPESIVWTSGATEANNIAIFGAANFYSRRGRHLITMKTEHKAVLAVMQELERSGFAVTYLEPQSDGRLSLADLAEAIRPETTLISVMWVNNETGVIQDIAAIAKLARERGVLLHVDAAQALGKVEIDVAAVQVDLLSLSAHKCYGPKGVGALYIRQQPPLRLQPLLYGGGQERGLRPGTIATQLVVGMGEACRLLSLQGQQRLAHVQALRDHLLQGLLQLPGVGLHIPSELTVAHCLGLYVEGIKVDALLARLPEIHLSTGSACNAASAQASPVLQAMRVNDLRAQNSLRVSLGHVVTFGQVDNFLQRFAEELLFLRSISPAVDSARGDNAN